MRALACLLLLLTACGDDDDDADADAGTDAGTGGEVDLAVCALENGPFSADVDNPYLPFVVGQHHVLEGLEGGTELAHFEVTVPDETAEVGGVTTRVVVKSEGPDPTDGEREYFAQAPDGTVCIFGEGDAEGLEWQAGEDGNLAGIFMPGSPAVGMTYEMIHGPDGIERAEITFVGVPTDTPAGRLEDTLTVLEDGPSIKKYARGIGEIYDDGIELISY